MRQSPSIQDVNMNELENVHGGFFFIALGVLALIIIYTERAN